MRKGELQPAAYVSGVDPLNLDPSGSLDGLAAAFTVAVFAVGLVVASLPAVMELVLRRHRPACLTMRAAFVAAYATVAVWVYRWLGSEYTRALAAVDPEGDCRGIRGDNSGCPAWDGQRYWPIIWGAVGLMAVVMARAAANRARRTGEVTTGGGPRPTA